MARRKSKALAPLGADEFSAAPLNLTTARDAQMFRTVTTLTRGRSARPFQWYNSIGEVHYGVDRNAKVAGYARLFACTRNPDGTPGDEITGGQEADYVASLSSPFGGQRAFVERFFRLMKIPGDSYLIRCREGDEIIGHDWLSAEEIQRNGTGDGGIGGSSEQAFKASDTIDRLLVPPGTAADGLKVPIRVEDFIGRVWRPAGQYVGLADSPMMALDSICEQLYLLTIGLRGKLLSRLALNGIMFVPSGITQIRGGQPDGKANETFHQNRVLNDLITACTWAVRNQESPESAIPIFMTGDGQYADQIKWITADRDIMEGDMKLRAELLDRILMGLDNTPSGVKGSSENNHWDSWHSNDEERRINVQPDIEMMCFALTRLGLWKTMQDRKLPSGRILNKMVWFDLSAAATKTNLAEDVRQARDRILVGDKAVRRYSGIPESDAPSDEEKVQMIGFKEGNPYLATFGLPISGRKEKTLDWDMVERFSTKKSGPGGDNPGGDSPVGPGVGDPGSPNPSDRKNNGPKRSKPA